MQGSSASNPNSDFANEQSFFPTVSTTDVVPPVLVARIGNVWESDLNSENVWERDDYHDVRIIELNSEYVRESDDDDDNDNFDDDDDDVPIIDLNFRWHPPLHPNAVVASALTMVELVVAEPEVTDNVYVPAPLMESPITEGHPLLELGLARREGLMVEAHVTLDYFHRNGDSNSENNINILENPLNPTFVLNEDVHDESDLELDDIFYQELLELEEQMRDFNIGLTEEYIVEHLRPLVYQSLRLRPSIEEDLCCICQEDYVNGEQVARLACAHQFHDNCITQWLMQKNSCPACRRRRPLTERN